MHSESIEFDFNSNRIFKSQLDLNSIQSDRNEIQSILNSNPFEFESGSRSIGFEFNYMWIQN